MVLSRLLSSRRSPNNTDKEDLEAEVGGRGGDVTELQENPRPSTETQRSELSEHGDRILKYIHNGHYACAICHDTISQGNKMWHCTMCHTVYHFTCVKKWSSRAKNRRKNKTLELKGRIWKCPGCPHLYEPISEPHCWCGKTKHANGVEFLGNANSCPSFCGKPTKCDHADSFCQRLCHPGPCPTLCNQECEGKQAAQDKQYSFWGRVKQRLKQRNYSAEEFHEVIILSAIVFVLYIIAGGVLWWDIQWFTRPDLYLEFHRRWWKLECGLYITFLVVCWFPLIFIFSVLFGATREFVVVAFDLKGSRGKRRLKNIGTLIMVPIWLAVYAAPIVSFAVGSDIVWRHQMKDSCSGYSTKIDIKTFYPRRSPVWSRIKFNSPSPGADQPTYQSLWSTDPFQNGTSFQSYYRFSGPLRNGSEVTIDVDVINHGWRIQHVSIDSDACEERIENRRDAYGRIYKLATYVFPENTIMSSDFSSSIGTNKSLELPQFNLTIPRFHDFITMDATQPFLRVFDTNVLLSRNITDVNGIEWNGQGTKDELYSAIEMRGLNLHMRGGMGQSLTICAKEGVESTRTSSGLFANGQQVTKKGMDEDLLVPLAIISAYRKYYKKGWIT